MYDNHVAVFHCLRNINVCIFTLRDDMAANDFEQSLNFDISSCVTFVLVALLVMMLIFETLAPLQ